MQKWLKKMNNVQFEKCKVCGRPKKYVMFLNGNKQKLVCKEGH